MAEVEEAAAPVWGRRSIISGGAALAAAGGIAVATAGAAGAQQPDDLPPTVGFRYVPATPFRVDDSREDEAGKILLGEVYPIDLSGIDADAEAVTLNLSVVNTQGQGFLTAYGEGRERPGVATIIWSQTGQALSNMVTVQTGTEDNDLLVYGGGPATHFVVDVYGWFI